MFFFCFESSSWLFAFMKCVLIFISNVFNLIYWPNQRFLIICYLQFANSLWYRWLVDLYKWTFVCLLSVTKWNLQTVDVYDLHSYIYVYSTNYQQCPNHPNVFPMNNQIKMDFPITFPFANNLNILFQINSKILNCISNFSNLILLFFFCT